MGLDFSAPVLWNKVRIDSSAVTSQQVGTGPNMLHVLHVDVSTSVVVSIYDGTGTGGTLLTSRIFPEGDFLLDMKCDNGIYVVKDAVHKLTLSYV